MIEDITKVCAAAPKTKYLKELGFSYLGNSKQSAKMELSYNAGTETYCLYLAPATMSGHNVCPCSKWCKANCLNGSGRNKGDIMHNGIEQSRINKARIKKTNLFFEDRDKFMEILINEILVRKAHAEKNGLEFSVRLNGTSDLSPLEFTYKGKNVLEILDDVQFYDYTKVPNRMGLISKYKNYDLTFSYDGHNWIFCDMFLRKGGKVAVVFDTHDLPKTYRGWKVINGNLNDMRYLNEPQTIIGLTYHRTAHDYESGKYVAPDTPFVVKPTDPLCEW